MPLPYVPKSGSIVVCDFQGLKAPEMVKKRPAVVVSPRSRTKNLCTIVPLSTTAPPEIRPHHHVLAFDPLLPWPYDAHHMWVKGDMLYTMSLERLDLPFYKDEAGKRCYVTHRIEGRDIGMVRRCILEALGLGRLKDHL